MFQLFILVVPIYKESIFFSFALLSSLYSFVIL